MKAPDLTGQVHGKLTVLSRAGTDKLRRALWLCRCECGVKKIIRADRLKVYKSCGCSKNPVLGRAHRKLRPKVPIHAGMVFGKLTVLARAGINQNGRLWKCQCACGKILLAVIAYNLQSGHSRSCGCSRTAA